MIVVIAGYVAIVVLWGTLFMLHRRAPEVWHQANKATWWLLLASAIAAVAWFKQSVLISLVGMICALTAVSFIFQVMTDWLRKKKVSHAAKLVWFEWFFILCLVLAHLFVLSYNYLHEIAA